MIEIGKTKVVLARRRVNGKFALVLNDQGEPTTKTLASEVWRVTRNKLGAGFGPDSKRPLVVGLVSGDLLVLKPLKTRQTVSVELKAVYAWVLRSKALKVQLEKARARKAKLAEVRQRRRLDAQERRLRSTWL